MNQEQIAARASARRGFFYALGAYGLWGFFPLYFKAMEHVPAMEMVAHRVIWSVPVALTIIAAQRRLDELISLFQNRRVVVMMSVTALLVSINWGIFIWAIAVNKTSEAALGYYINPLITVFLGFALLGEKLNALQKTAVAMALLAVVIRTIGGGVVEIIPSCPQGQEPDR